MKLYQNEEWLYDQYWNQNKNQYQIAFECKVHKDTISRYMRFFKIPPRNKKKVQENEKIIKLKIKEEDLFNLYWNKGKSISKIAKEYNLSDMGLFYYFKKYKIPTRDHLESRYFKKKYVNKDWLYEQYITLEKSANLIAEENNFSNVTILNWLCKYNIPIRSTSEAQKLAFKKGRAISYLNEENRYKWSGKNNHLWKGDNVSSSGAHHYLNTHNDKSEKCIWCGKGNCKISFCFDHYKKKHTRDPDDYIELCDKCHLNRDYYEFGIHSKKDNKYKEFKLICENGVNFGDLNEAKEMIKEAKKIKAWGSKFQIYSEEQIKENKNYKFLKAIKLNFDSIKELYEFGKKINMNVFFSCMTEESIDWCNELNIPFIKIRHLDQKNYSLLWKAFLVNIPCFISTDYFIPFRTNFIPLFCIPKYPANINDYNYSNNIFYQGISDHCSSLDLLLKTKKEKRLIYFEKHVKLDGTTPLEDAWSVSFSQLKEVLDK